MENGNMQSAAPTPSRPSNRPSYTCIRCSERKVRCDRQHPCNACTKHNVECLYRPHPTPRKRRRRAKDDILKDRLERYEALLQEQGIDPTQVQDILHNQNEHETGHTKAAEENTVGCLPTPASTSSEVREFTKTQLLQGQERSTFVDNSLWTRVVEEIPDPEGVWEEDGSCEASDTEASESDFAFVVGIDPRSRIRFVHPTSQQILQLWQIFTENVDPLIKIVHVPSLKPAVQKAATNIENVPKHFEALMFAIYSMAVLSLKDIECKQKFGEARKTLLSRYISDTKNALSQANFMATTNLVVLQALILHIFSIRDVYEPRIVWNLTGLATRIAQGMGLDRYGISLGLSPFESEIRQRIWWQLKMHDIRTAELNGLAKFRCVDLDFHLSKLPANANDQDLYPGMTSPPVDSNAKTDMTFCLLRCEMGSKAARITAKVRQEGQNNFSLDEYVTRSDPGHKGTLLAEVEELLETKFIRYCDPSEPLQLFTMLFARTVINTGRFMSHHPRRWANVENIPESEKEMVWNVAIKLLEQHDMMQSTRQLQRFAWHIPYYLHWHAFIHVLDTLRDNPLKEDADKAWNLVEITYENNLDMLLNTKRPLHVAVGNLCLKAFDAYQAALASQGSGDQSPPEYIKKLRNQREAAKARRQARIAKKQGSSPLVNQQKSYQQQTIKNSDASAMPVGDQNGSAESQQRSQNELVVPNSASNTTDTDNFWLTNNFGDGLFGGSSDMMNIDADFMLAQDFDSGSNFNQPFDWNQLNNWYGDFGVANASPGNIVTNGFSQQH